MTSEVIVAPVEELEVIPAVDAGNQDVAQSPMDGDAHISESVWSKESGL